MPWAGLSHTCVSVSSSAPPATLPTTMPAIAPAPRAAEEEGGGAASAGEAAGGGGGATGGGSDEIFYENDQTVTTDYTVTASHNAVTAGPITVNNGITVTIPSGVRWVVV